MTRSNPEAALQISVKKYLGWCLPPEILWTANNAGVTLGATKEARLRQGARSKAMGVKKGWPDLQFCFPDGITRYIELKAVTGALSQEQRDFRQHCLTARSDTWALCRSLDEVEATLRGWGAEMKNHEYAPMAWPEVAA